MKIIHIGDIFAIPMFVLLFVYLIKNKDKTVIEYILLLFSIFGFIFDVYFSIYYILMKQKL